MEELVCTIQSNLYGASPIQNQEIVTKNDKGLVISEPIESQGDLEGIHDKSYNLIYIFNQLMTHQCILNMSFSHNINGGKDVLKKSYEAVYNIFKFHVNHFKLEIDTGDVFDFLDHKYSGAQEYSFKPGPKSSETHLNNINR